MPVQAKVTIVLRVSLYIESDLVSFRGWRALCIARCDWSLPRATLQTKHLIVHSSRALVETSTVLSPSQGHIDTFMWGAGWPCLRLWAVVDGCAYAVYTYESAGRADACTTTSAYTFMPPV